MIYQSGYMEEQAVLQTAAKMCAAARTAPKAHGKDTIQTLVLTGEEKELLAKKMEEVGAREMGAQSKCWYGRDAANVRRAGAVVLIGAERKPRGVPYCGYCGFSNCGDCEMHGAACSFVYVDLGIAVSSAAAAAAAEFVDNRIMFSIGKAEEETDAGKDVAWLGIPISISGKSIFFDRGIVHD